MDNKPQSLLRRHTPNITDDQVQAWGKVVCCPACQAVIDFLVEDENGRLLVAGPREVEVTGFRCSKCGKRKHWHDRKAGKGE